MLSYIEEHYDLSSVERIYLYGDGDIDTIPCYILLAEGLIIEKEITGGKSVADTMGRKLVVLVLLTVIVALAVLQGGCKSGETRTLESENARLRQKVAALEEKVQRLEAELAPLKKPLTINHRTYPAKLRFVEKETPLLAMPREGSVVLRNIPPRSVVKVLNAADSDGELWLYVEVPVYDTPSNMMGWIREADSVPLTEENRKLVQDVTVRAGTRVYEVFEFAKIASTQPVKLLRDERGRLEEKRDGYARISCPGGWDFWVEERFVVYPAVD